MAAERPARRDHGVLMVVVVVLVLVEQEEKRGGMRVEMQDNSRKRDLFSICDSSSNCRRVDNNKAHG